MNRMPARVVVSFVLLVLVASCAKKPLPPPPGGAGGPSTPPIVTPGGGAPPPPGRPPEPPVVGGEAGVGTRPFDGLDVEAINKNSALKPVFFRYDADTIDDEGRKILDANAEVLKTYGTWVITIEGHCDERGTSEYNLALGDRRALAAKNYLLTLGIPADRLRTVSYGKEFPFDPGKDEGAFSQNRRAHFMLTSK